MEPFIALSDSNTGQPTESWSRLYDAHALFIKELAIVKQSLDVFRVIGINIKHLKGPGKQFLNYASMFSQRTFVTGIESLFERTNGGAGLCSIRGLLLLAKEVPLTNKRAHYEFVQKYEIKASDDWMTDLEKVLEKQRPELKACLELTSKVRNNRVAHLSHPQHQEVHMLPDLNTSEKAIAFAYDFYCFIACGFLQSGCPAKLPDEAGKSLLQLITVKFGLVDAKFDLPHIPEEQ